MEKLFTLKRALSAAVLLMVSLLSWGEKFEVDGITYYINNDKTTVSVTKGNREYSGDIVIPPTVTYKGVEYSVTKIRDGFNNCDKLTSVKIPNSVTTLGDYAFFNCRSLTTIEIPNSVTLIQGAVFASCSSITTIIIGSGIKKIEDSAFDLNSFDKETSLTSMTCFAEEVPDTEDSFGIASMPLNKMTLYVPASSVSKYKNTFPWKDFGKILPIQTTTQQ